MFGMFDWLVPAASSAKKRRSSETKGLLGFPSTPAYGGRKKAKRSAGGLVGFLGFPSTPSYQDASVSAFECSGDESGDEDANADGASDSSQSPHGTR